jgi:hypothetical protein
MPDTPIVFPRTGDFAMTSQGSPALQGPARMAARPNCLLCGAPRGDRLHVDGETKADAESPRWG